MEWKKLNIIDCPGSDDFVGAAITALNVTDTAILLLNGQYGPEVGTQNHFRYTEKLGKPVIFWSISLIMRNVTMTMCSNSCVAFMAPR